MEFRAAFQKLLVCHPLITSKGTNVITNATGILTISSRKPTEIQLTSKSPPDQTQEYEIEVDYSTLLVDELNDMDQYDHHVIASVALSIEQKLIQKMNICKHKYKCSQCIELLLTSSEKIHDNLLAMKVTNSQPSKSTVDIVTFANAVMKWISKQRGQGNDHNAVLRTIYNNLIIDDLYTNENFELHEHKSNNLHKDEFVKQLIEIYLQLKSNKIGKKITDEERGELIRNRRKQDVHHAGQ